MINLRILRRGPKELGIDLLHKPTELAGFGQEVVFLSTLSRKGFRCRELEI